MRADDLKVAVPPAAESFSLPEISSPMLEVRAPHQGVHTWKDFFHPFSDHRNNAPDCAGTRTDSRLRYGDA